MYIQWYPGHMTKTRRMMEENISLVDVVIALEEGFAEVELVHQPEVGNSLSLVLVTACGNVVGSAEAAAGIPLVGREVAYGLANILYVAHAFGGRSRVYAVVGTGGERQAHAC